MTPASKEEIYLANLCGENWKLPYPATRLEYYYAKLCGMNVPLPSEPLTRPEFYLAYLCGMDVKLPEPVSRKEWYMAKRCGMDVAKLPEPLSKAEIYWSMLDDFVKTVSGTLPISLSCNGNQLVQYRIYGNTKNVGTEASNHYVVPMVCTGKNLLKIDAVSQQISGVNIGINNGVITCNGTATETIILQLGYADYQKNKAYQVSGCPDGGNTTTTFRLFFDNIGTVKDSQGQSFQPTRDYARSQIRMFIYEGYHCENLIFTPQIENANVITSFEPYHEPITIEIDIGAEPLGEGDYVDFQKNIRHNADGTTIPLTLPPIPTFYGTTIIDSPAEIPPSTIDVKYFGS